MFMKTYDEAIKRFGTEGDKFDTVVQAVNEATTKIQEDVQAAKQGRMQLRNYLVTELSKPKTFTNDYLT